MSPANDQPHWRIGFYDLASVGEDPVRPRSLDAIQAADDWNVHCLFRLCDVIDIRLRVHLEVRINGKIVESIARKFTTVPGPLAHAIISGSKLFFK